MKIAIVGQPCSGKTTLLEALEKEGYERIVPYTTRPIRKGEIHGIDYHFIKNEAFKRNFANDFFAEITAYEAEFGHCFYGSAAADYEDDLNKVIALNPRGVLDVSDRVFVVYLDMPYNTLKKRAKERGDSLTEIIRRIHYDRPAFDNMVNTIDIGVHIKRQAPVDVLVKRVQREIRKSQKLHRL